jgi:hypothetical protein
LQLLIVSAETARKLQDEIALEHVRATARAESIDATRERFLRVDREAHAAACCFEEALINLDEDECDDFETAQAKAEKLERIERELDIANKRWEHAFLRCGWEAKDAE